MEEGCKTLKIYDDNNPNNRLFTFSAEPYDKNIKVVFFLLFAPFSIKIPQK